MAQDAVGHGLAFTCVFTGSKNKTFNSDGRGLKKGGNDFVAKKNALDYDTQREDWHRRHVQAFRHKFTSYAMAERVRMSSASE
jgi:hypothetical protein